MKENPVVASSARTVVPLADAILGAMQFTGPALFSRLLKERASHVPPPAETARSLFRSAKLLAAKAREKGLIQVAQDSLSSAKVGVKLAATAPGKIQASIETSRAYFLKLPNAQDKAEYVVAVVLYLLSFLGGFAVGFQVPQVDFKMKRQGPSGDRIVLHAFPLMVVELATEWLTTVLEHVSDSKNLSPTDHRRAESLAQIARNLKSGVRSGAATLAWQKRNLGLTPLQGGKDVEVALHKQAFNQAEQLFRLLTQGKPS